METCRLPKHRCFFKIMALASMLALLSACATATKTVAPQVTAPPVPTVVTGHVVDIKKSLPVRVDTNLSSRQLGDLKLGDKVNIDEESGDWYHVTEIPGTTEAQPPSKYPKAKPIRSGPLSGWVLSRYIEKDIVIPPSQVETGQTEQTQEKSKGLTGMKIRTVLEGTAAGAAVGAGLGALTAYITGGDVGKGAIIGAAAGGATGLVAGVYVANQKEKFATEEAYLDACTKEAAEYNEEARKANDYLRGYVADTQRRVNELKAQIRKDKAKKQLARDELSTLNEKKQGTDEMIAKMEEEIKAQDGALAGVKNNSPQSKALQQEVQTTRQEIGKLRKQREDLVKLTTKMNDLTV